MNRTSYNLYTFIRESLVHIWKLSTEPFTLTNGNLIKFKLDKFFGLVGLNGGELT